MKAIVKGAYGGFYTAADIGRDELPKDLGVDSKRIPACIWILPVSLMVEAGIDSSNRHRLQPDIMFVEMGQMGNNERMHMAVHTAASELTTKNDLKELGVDTTASKRILRDIHLHSVESAAKMVTQRRIMDRDVFSHPCVTARHRQAFFPIQSLIEDWQDPLACLWLP